MYLQTYKQIIWATQESNLCFQVKQVFLTCVKAGHTDLLLMRCQPHRCICEHDSYTIGSQTLKLASGKLRICDFWFLF
jgi:hypothetical protein